MSYLINEIFYTIKGEGYWSGRPAVFCRLSRCNLWTGREEDRASAVCNFCDTDFNYAERLDVDEVVDRVFSAWPTHAVKPMVVFTGGEPLLQLDAPLINKLKDLGFYTAVETNGTIVAPNELDWVCVSPKILTRLKQTWAHELKLVYPQLSPNPRDLEYYPASVKWLSPMDGPKLAENTQAVIDYVMKDPRWRMNVQTHKMVGVK